MKFTEQNEDCFWLQITGVRRHSVDVFVVLLFPPLTALNFYQTLMSSFKVDAHCRPIRAASNTLRKFSLNILCHRLFSGSFMTFPDLQSDLWFPFIPSTARWSARELKCTRRCVFLNMGSVVKEIFFPNLNVTHFKSIAMSHWPTLNLLLELSLQFHSWSNSILENY